MPKECRSTNVESVSARLEPPHSSFGIRISFVIRISIGLRNSEFGFGSLSSRGQLFDGLSLFFVELIEQSFFPQAKRATRLAIRRVAFGAVVKAPTGGTAGDRTAQVGNEIGGRG